MNSTSTPAIPLNGTFSRLLEEATYLECVHCGLCLPHCPTYSELGTEMDSPRGRIYLLRALAEGKVELTDTVIGHLDLCLDCRACESACPSGVHYGQLIESGRTQIAKVYRRGWRERLLSSVLLEGIFPHPQRLRLLLEPLRQLRLAGFFDAPWVDAVMRRTGLKRMEQLVPDLVSPEECAIPALVSAVGEKRRRVAFLSGCVTSVFFARANAATVEVLSRFGCEVLTPPEQECCGAIQAHTGNEEGARAAARRNIDTFGRLDVDYVVVNAAGCGSTMKEYGHLLADDPIWASRAREFAAKVRDITEVLAELPPPPLCPLDATVTYHEPCHLVHGQKLKDPPRRVLQMIPGLILVPLQESDWCCGSAGVYNITQPEMSERLLERKVCHILETGAEIVATGNPGCLLQVQAGLRVRGITIEVVHPVELLHRCLVHDAAPHPSAVAASVNS